jgi:predicted nucleotidyltransferase
MLRTNRRAAVQGRRGDQLAQPAQSPASSGIRFDVVKIRVTMFPMFPSAQRTTAILHERESNARERRGLREADARRIVQQIVSEHVKPPAQMWLIGSLAWGEFGEHSDVDLVFSGVDRALVLQVENEVARTLGTPVDVLELQQLPNSFRDRILQTGLKLV